MRSRLAPLLSILVCAACQRSLVDDRDAAGADDAAPRDATSGPPDLAGLDLVGPSYDLSPILCEASGPNATVDGTTPLGAFHGRYAWLAFARADCDDTPILIITEKAPLPVMFGSYDPPAVAFWPGRSDAGTYLGTTTTPLVVYIGTQMASGSAQVTLTQIDTATVAAGRAEGSLAISGMGWSLSGTFRAERCAPLDMYCI